MLQCVHGLSVSTEVPLPDLDPIEWREPDVVLDIAVALPRPDRGAARLYGDGEGEDRVLICRGVDGRVTFRYGDGIGFDLRDDGRTAHLQAVIPSGLALDDMAAYLYGPVLGYVLRSRGMLALHASSVAIETGAVLFAGASGFGKSTLAASFAIRGFPVLSDDLTAITRSPDGWMAHPAFRHVRLWPSGDDTRLPGTASLKPITPTWDKRRFPLSAQAFQPRPVPLRAIYVIDARADEPDRPLAGSLPVPEAILSLASATSGSYLLDVPMRARELRALGALVRAIPVRRLAPHADSHRLGQLCDVILEDLRTGDVRV